MKNIAIRENHLYKKVYTGGKKCGGKYAVIYVLKDKKAYRLKIENPMKKYVNRIGLTVTKKQGNAVTRSRIKRVLRAAYAEVEKAYGVKKGNLIVIAARSSASQVSAAQVYLDLVRQLKKLDMLLSDTPCTDFFGVEAKEPFDAQSSERDEPGKADTEN